MSSSRHAGRGILNVPVGSSTNTLRATKCSQSRTVSPFSTGATGIRSSAASFTTSAVECCVVHAWTASFHSVHRCWRPTNMASCSSPRRSVRSIRWRKASNWARLLVQKPA